MANTEIITFRAAKNRQQRRIMDSKLRAIQGRHPDARIVSVNVARRSALQWDPCKLDVTMVVEWADAAPAVRAAPTSGVSGSVVGQPTGSEKDETRAEYLARINATSSTPQSVGSDVFTGAAWRNWTDETGRLTTPAKIVLWLVLWPFMAPWWLWKNPRFTTKTKAVVTAVTVAVIAVLAAVAPSETTPAPGPAIQEEPKAATTTSFDAYTDSVTGAGVSCEELSGMWESARRDKDLVQGTTYVAAWEKYCSQYGSIAARAH